MDFCRRYNATIRNPSAFLTSIIADVQNRTPPMQEGIPTFPDLCMQKFATNEMYPVEQRRLLLGQLSPVSPG